MKDFKSIAPNTTASCLGEMPTMARAFFLLGLQREEQGNVPEALADYEAAQRLGKKHANWIDQRIVAIKARIWAAA